MKTRIIIASLMWIAFANTVFASGTFDHVDLLSDGVGYVYASEDELDYDKVPFESSRSSLFNSENPEPENGTIYWIYAKPEINYEFIGWRNDDNGMIFSTSLKQKMTYESGNIYAFTAIFSRIGGYKLSGVPEEFNVFVNNIKILSDDNGDYYINRDENVRIEWSENEGYFCNFDCYVDVTGIPHGITFKMPKNDITFSCVRRESLLSGVPEDFKVYVWDNLVSPVITINSYNIVDGSEVRIEWERDGVYFCSFDEDVSFLEIEHGITFEMPKYDITFSATYKGFMLSDVPNDVSVFVNNNKTSPEADGVYYILPDQLVRLEWDANYKFSLDPEIQLTSHQQHSISFTMPSSHLKLILEEVLNLNGEENSTVIANHQNSFRDVVFNGHTFYLDGEWNTLCLPFNLDALAGTPLEGFTVKQLDTETEKDGHATGIDNGTLYLNFKDASSIAAGVPYIVKKAQLKEDAATPRYTATGGTDGSLPQQGYNKLVDGTTDGYMWRTGTLPSNCEFNTDAPVRVEGYTLYTGNQNVNGDPRVWTLKAKLNKDDTWTTIDSRNVDEVASDALPNGRKDSKTYTTQKPGTYQYFLFEVTKTNGNFMCLAELALKANYLTDFVTVENPFFTDVKFSSTTPTAVTSSDGAVSFTGIYDRVSIGSEGDNTKLFMGEGSKLYYPDAAMNINAFHAYFQLNDGFMCGKPNQGGSINAFVLNLDDGSPATDGIFELPDDADISYRSDKSDRWFSLDGRCLNGKPTVRGIYIFNNQKVVIK